MWFFNIDYILWFRHTNKFWFVLLIVEFLNGWMFFLYYLLLHSPLLVFWNNKITISCPSFLISFHFPPSPVSTPPSTFFLSIHLLLNFFPGLIYYTCRFYFFITVRLLIDNNIKWLFLSIPLYHNLFSLWRHITFMKLNLWIACYV